VRAAAFHVRLRVGRAAKKRVDIHAGHRHGQQAHGRKHGVAAAHVLREGEHVVAVFRGQGVKRVQSGRRGDDDAPAHVLLAP
jgi:hypothetical protein